MAGQSLTQLKQDEYTNQATARVSALHMALQTSKQCLLAMMLQSGIDLIHKQIGHCLAWLMHTGESQIHTIYALRLVWSEHEYSVKLQRTSMPVRMQVS